MSLRPYLRPWRFFLEMGARLFNPHPIYAKKRSYQTPPFFIVSNGRSGTTLLRAMLLQNPTVHIPPEFKLLAPLLERYQNLYRHVPWRYAVSLFGSTIAGTSTLLEWEMTLQDFFARAKALPPAQHSLTNLVHLFYFSHAQQVKPNATRWGDKTPLNIRNLETIDKLFPDAKIIHLLRDGRDVAASIHNLGWHDSLAETCDHLINNLEAVSTYPQRDNEDKFLEIRYESLVSEPEEELKKLCNFIELAYQPEMLHFYQRREVLGFEGGQDHHAGLKRPINTESVGSWRSRLTPAEQAYVVERLTPMLDKLGYAV